MINTAKSFASIIRLAILLTFASVAAFGQCTFTISPTAPFVDSAAQGGIVLQVTASAQTCAWTASSTGFASAGAPASGTGNGSVTYSVTANTTGVDRTATVTVAGLVVTITQRWTAAIFSDVSPSISYFNAANLMSQNAITVGCATTPTLQYCGEANVTRRQMAVFIVRTILGGGPNANNFNYSTTPYFTDVPATDVNFRFVQKLRDMGVTAGCSATAYCPDANVTRDQMAVFIVRARLGSTAAYTFNPTPFFTDVPADYQPANFFRAIQKLREIGITAGCTATAYCPASFVTRGAMAIFLTRAGFNTLFSATTPLITSVSPNSGIAGSALNVALTGLNTNFVQGTTTVTANNGVIAGTPTVTDATHLSVLLTIPQGTVLGPISLTAVTGTQEATLPNGFTVGLGDPLPTITSFSPASGPIGTAVTLTGTGLVSSSGTPADVRLPLLGGGVGSAPLTASSVTSLSFVIPSTATTGNITVAGSSGSATSATAFTVTPSSTFTIAAGPSAANLIAGEEATYTVTLASANGFTGLAQLSLTGLPAGVTAVLKPAQLAVGQQSLITLKASSTQAASTSTLVFRATATVDGIPLSLSTSVVLNVTPITTTLRGRTVVDNTEQTSLAGVVVTMLGKDGSGNNTGCTGSTISDASGNFALTGLSAGCIGPQLVGFGGDNVTSPSGKYAGVDLIFTLVGSRVVVSPVLVHLPRIDNVETFLVKQNFGSDQSYTYTSIPGTSVIVYAGTVMTKADGTQPNPFPLAAIEVAVDRLPDPMPPTTAGVAAFIVAFQPANAVASKPVAVWFPNTLNTAPGTNVPLLTLDPTRGRPVPYGTGTISNDGKTIIPDVDPASGALNRRFGIVHFDWHGPLVLPPPRIYPTPDPNAPTGGDPVDLATGLSVINSTDLVLVGSRGSLTIKRTYRPLNDQVGPFGVGSFHNFEYRLDTNAPQSAAIINLSLPGGARIPFTRQADGTLINATMPVLSGAVMTTAADGATALRFRTGDTFQFIPGDFQTGSVLVSMTDTNGNARTIVRPSGIPQQISEIRDPVGRKLTFAYDTTNRITSITDPIGRVVSYTYNAAGTLATYTNVAGGVTQYTYDSQNRITSVVDPRGVTVLQDVYDANGRVIQQTVPGGGKYLFSYTLVNALVATSPVQETRVTDPNGNVTTYRFSAPGFLLGVTDALGKVRTFTLASGTNALLAVQGPGSCSSCGATVSGDMTFTYDAAGNRLTETDGLGNTTTYTYEPLFNQVTSITDALGNVTLMGYDGRGNLTSVKDARGNTATYTYDSTGLMKTATDATGQTTSFAYDSQGNMNKVTNAAGKVTSRSYDAVSRIVAQLDSLGRTSTLTYNAFDQWIQSAEANGQTTTLTYDNVGLLKSYTDGNGGKVTLTYDATGRLTARTDQLNRASTLTYDLTNNVISSTNRRGQQSVFAFDALHRVVSETYADSTVQRTYDSYGRLSRVVDSAAGTFTNAYDLSGRQLSQTGPFGAITYTRDKDHRVLTRQVTGQPLVTYAYDPNGNVTSASMTGATIGETYDARNLPATLTRSNGVNTVFAYDAVGRAVSFLEQKNTTTVLSRAYTYDAAGQLVSSSVESGSALTTPAAAATFNAANRILTSAGTTYTHDLDGNRLTEASAAGTISYTWDARGRLQAIAAPGVTTTFLYDYDGNMIQKRVTNAAGSTIERYILDDMTNVAAREVVGVGTVSLLTGRAIDSHLAVVSNGAGVFASIDRLNSVVAVTDAAGAVSGTASYEPFGQTTASTQTYPFGFTGRQQVSGNLYYLRARYLDVSTGRFLSEDPLGISSGSADLYSYVGNNPTNGIDPFGLQLNINLFPPDSATSKISGYSEKVPSTGNFKVGLHGNPQSVVDGSGNPLTPKQLADLIKADPNYKPGSPVDLLSCNTGKGDNPFAQQLANELGATVNAPNAFGWYYPNGDIRIAPGATFGPGGNVLTPDLTHPGQLRTFQPVLPKVAK